MPSFLQGEPLMVLNAGKFHPYKCAMIKSRVFLGMGDLPPLIGNLIMGIINPYGLGLSLSPIVWK